MPAAAHRADWVDRAAGVIGQVGLTAEARAANDPFFGTAGSILAKSQRAQNLKTELVISVGNRDVAVASMNEHQDHFGQTFGIRTGGHGEVAHTSCVGFGLERLALCVIYIHGYQPRRWPEPIRDALAA